LRANTLEVAQVLRQAVGQEILGALPRLALLVLVVQTCGNRMMRVMHFVDEVGNRQLLLVRPQPAGLVPRRKLMPVAEKEQNVGRLGYDSPASLEERGSKRQLAAFPTVEKPHQPRDAESLTSRPRYVDVLAARLLQSEAHVLTPSLDCRPVIKLVPHSDTSVLQEASLWDF
jgi:hypothetical protein